MGLILALRPGEPREGRLLAQLTATPKAMALRPRPLSREAVAALGGAAFQRPPDPEFSEACHATAAGNPYFLHALLRELQLEGVGPTAAQARRVRALGPRAVSRAVLMRVATLPGGPALSRAVAVLGDGAGLHQAAALANLDEPSASKAADLLVRASIFKRGRELEFVHPIVRQAVYVDLAPHERAELHSRAARVVEAAGAPAERVAAQLLATELKGDQRVVEMMRAAASEASRRGMPEAAIRYLERALDEPPAAETRAELLLELGQAKTLARLPEAIEHLSDALDLATDPDKTAAAGLALGRALALVGRPQESAEAFRRTLDKIGEGHPELRLTLESEMLLGTRLASGRPRPLPADLDRHRPEAAPAGTPA